MLKLPKHRTKVKLTDPNPELTQMVHDTWNGMARWAGFGPAGMTCRHCVFWQHRNEFRQADGTLSPARCKRYTELSNKQKLGDRVPHFAKSCREFVLSDDVPRINERPK